MMWYLVLGKCDGAWWWYARTLLKIPSVGCLSACFKIDLSSGGRSVSFLTFSHYRGWISNTSAPAAYAEGLEIISVHGRPVGAAITSDSIDQWIVQACKETRLWRTWCLCSLHSCTLLNVAHSILHVTYKPSEYVAYIIVWNSNQVTPCISASFTDLCDTLSCVCKRLKSCNF